MKDSSKIDPRYKKIREFAEYFHGVYKTIEDYSEDPIQMEKELNNFHYVNSDKFDKLLNSFYPTEGAIFPPHLLEEYFSGGIDLDTGRIHGEKEFNIIKNNLEKLSNLKLQKIPFSNPLDKELKGIEKGPIMEIIENMKREKVEINTSRKTKLIYRKSKKIKLNLPEFPSGLKWEEITIRFLNGDDVQITAKGLVFSSNCELMGFQNEKTKTPNLQWTLLKILSMKNGYLNWDNNKNLDKKTRDNTKKQKQELSEKLSIYFNSVEGSPFFEYKAENGYKIKMHLIPEQGSGIESTTYEAKATIIDFVDDDNDNDPESFDE